MKVRYGFPRDFHPERDDTETVRSWRGQLAKMTLHEYHLATEVMTLTELYRVLGIRMINGWIQELNDKMEEIKRQLLSNS